MNKHTNGDEETGIVATATLREALRAMRIPGQAILVLSGFRVMVPKQDLLGSGWSS